MANKCIECRKITVTKIEGDDYYSCNGRAKTAESIEPRGENCFVKARSIVDDSPSNTFLIEEYRTGTIVTRYEIDAKDEDEAQELFKDGYHGRKKDSSFSADYGKPFRIEVHKKR